MREVMRWTHEYFSHILIYWSHTHATPQHILASQLIPAEIPRGHEIVTFTFITIREGGQTQKLWIVWGMEIQLLLPTAAAVHNIDAWDSRTKGKHRMALGVSWDWLLGFNGKPIEWQNVLVINLHCDCWNVDCA